MWRLKGRLHTVHVELIAMNAYTHSISQMSSSVGRAHERPIGDLDGCEDSP
jgi:hypothetical protein